MIEGCMSFGSSPGQVPIIYQEDRGEGQLRAGTAVVDITPLEDVWLAGFDFLRRSQGVHSPLKARALVFEKEEILFAIVSLDLIGVQREHILQVKQKIKHLKIPSENIIICSTHTHSGPDTLGFWGLPPFFSGIDKDYMSFLEESIETVLKNALETLRPAEVAAGAVLINPKGILKNLRRKHFVDRELVVLHVREQNNGKTIATLVELGCHPEVLDKTNNLITPDFPYWIIRSIETQKGGVGIYVSGAIGGLVTPDLNEDNLSSVEERFLAAENLGEKVGEYALQIIDKLSNYNSTPVIELWHAPVYLHVTNYRYNFARFTNILDRKMYQDNHLESEINYWKMGSLNIVTVPGEITPDLGLRIKHKFHETTMIIGLANDELGYLLPKAEFHTPYYSYERTFSPGPNAGDRIIRLLEDILILRGDKKNKP